MFNDHKRLSCATLVVVVAVGIPFTTEAQEVASSLDQLRQLVKVGDTVIVTDLQGRQIRGSIAEISSSSLGLIVGGARTDFSESDLDTVSRRDSRWNGTLWGLAIGAAVGLSFEKSLSHEYGRDDIGYGSVVVPFAGLGASVGFAVDAMIKGRRIIYASRRSSTMNARRSRHSGTSTARPFSCHCGSEGRVDQQHSAPSFAVADARRPQVCSLTQCRRLTRTGPERRRELNAPPVSPGRYPDESKGRR
jgi:hypothetical protein